MRNAAHRVIFTALLVGPNTAQAQLTTPLGARQCQTPQDGISISIGTGSESSFSIAYGSDCGINNGDAYAIASTQVGAPIPVRWSNGEDDQATMHHLINDRITELCYGKQVLGHAMCNM